MSFQSPIILREHSIDVLEYVAQHITTTTSFILSFFILFIFVSYAGAVTVLIQLHFVSFRFIESLRCFFYVELYSKWTFFVLYKMNNNISFNFWFKPSESFFFLWIAHYKSAHITATKMDFVLFLCHIYSASLLCNVNVWAICVYVQLNFSARLI